MVTLTFHFTPREQPDQHGEDLFKCPLFRTLPKPMQEGTQGHPHLLEYLHMLPLEELGLPEYRAALTREDGEIKLPNLIYPVGSGVFTHICPDPEDARDFYISVEPSLAIDLEDVMARVEARLLDFFGVLGDVETDEEKREALLALATQYPPGDIDDPEVFDAYSDELCALLWHGGSEPD